MGNEIDTRILNAIVRFSEHSIPPMKLYDTIFEGISPFLQTEDNVEFKDSDRKQEKGDSIWVH